MKIGDTVVEIEFAETEEQAESQAELEVAKDHPEFEKRRAYLKEIRLVWNRDLNCTSPDSTSLRTA